MKLFSLIVGIDGYQSVRPLQGCVNDAQRIKTYIESDFIKNKVTATDMCFLTEAQATKAGIVAAFETVAKNISANDIFFFYFSGHGVREETKIPIFANAEADGAIETLVCYDSKVTAAPGYKDNTFLADKELRYLLAQIAAKNAKIFTVFDNCHSGDNTRALVNELSFQENSQTIAARIVDLAAVKERAWEGFIFANKIDKSKLDGTIPLNDIIPLAPHIHISACRDVEKAYEGPQTDGKRGGYFTEAFTRIMRSTQGNISLYHLQIRLSNILRREDNKSQNPQIDVYSGNPMDIHKSFLFSEMGSDSEINGYLDQNPAGGFQISIGALNGAKKDMEITVTQQSDTSKTWKGKVTKTTPGHSHVSVAGNFVFNKAETYQVTGKVANYAMVNLFLDTDADDGIAKKVLSEHPYHNQYYKIVMVEDEAEYVLRAVKETPVSYYKMTLHCDSRPIIGEIAEFAASKVAIAAEDLKQISQWHFVKALKNGEKVDDALTNALKVSMYQMDFSIPNDPNSILIERELNIDKATTTVHTTGLNKKGVPFSWIRFEIENTANVDMYVSFLMLSSLFGISPDVLQLEDGVNVDKVILKPKDIIRTKSVKSQPGFFRFSFNDYILKGNWVGQNLYFKLIASSTPFLTRHLTKNDIPEPYTGGERGVDFDDDEEVASDFWFTKEIELFFPNTKYQ